MAEYTTNPAEISARAQKFLSRTDEELAKLVWPYHSHLDITSAMASVRALVAAVGEETSETKTLLMVYGSGEQFWNQCLAKIDEREKAAAKAKLMAETVEVREWKGGRLAKPQRVPHAEASPTRPGHFGVTFPARAAYREDDGRDNLSFAGTVEAPPIGRVVEQDGVVGKVVSARLVGRQWRCLAKPMTLAAAKSYREQQAKEEADRMARHTADWQ